jgi:hypothetical protein
LIDSTHHVKAGWPARLVFWAATVASCGWLILSAAICAIGFRLFLAHGFKPTGRGPLEIVTACALASQPLVILFLIARAVRLRGAGRPLRVVARAFYPLGTAALLLADVKAFEFLDYQSDLRVELNRQFGSITYLCSTYSPDADYNPKTIGQITMRLVEHRHPGELSSWIVMRAGKPAVAAVSFGWRTGSIGGSQGIRWREPDGQTTTAAISFSDVVSEHGPDSIWVTVVRGNTAPRTSPPELAAGATNFTCGPDPQSYRQ